MNTHFIVQKGYLRIVNIFSVLILLAGLTLLILGIVNLSYFYTPDGNSILLLSGVLALIASLTTLAKKPIGWYLIHLYAFAFTPVIIGIFVFIGLYKNKRLYFYNNP